MSLSSLSPRPADAAGPLGVLGRLTDRDRTICRLLWEHRVLTTDQVTELAFDSLTSAQHRLVALHRLGVLERFRPLRPTGSESWRYTLGPLGATVVAAERATKPPTPAALRARVVALAASPRLDHTLGVNGFFTALTAAARHHPDRALEAWWSERRAGAEWGELVRPDAYGVWRDRGATVEFFLEYDTGTETLARVAAKLSGYADLAEAEDRSRPVLFWLTRPGREPELRKALGRPPVPVATAAAGQGQRPAGPVWLPAGSPGPRRTLAELADRH